MTTFSDDFNRADTGTLGANWTEDATGFSILSNEAQCDGTASVAWYNTTCSGDDNWVQVTAAVISTNPNQAFCRGNGSTASPTGYSVQVHSGTPQLTKYVSNTRTLLGADPGSAASGDVFYCEASGSTITSKLNGTQLQQATDTSITTGTYIGLRGAATTLKYDNFSGGDLASGDATFTTVVGTVTAAGGSSTFTGGATFTTVVGEVTAAGGSSTFTGGATFTTVVGVVTASGGDSTFDVTNPDAEFTTVVGVVTASGGESTFGEVVEGGGGPVRRPMWWPEEPKKPKVRVDAKFVTLTGEVTASGGVSTFTVVPYSLTVDGDMRQVLELLELV